MILQEVRIIKPLAFTPVSTELFALTSPYWVDFITDEGVWKLRNKTSWLTDLRSGSSWIDCLIPKMGNQTYTAGILLHDTCFSGKMSFDLANEMLRQCMILSKEVGPLRAGLAHTAVSKFGRSHYFGVDDDLPEPYTINRVFEGLTLEAK